LTSYLITTTDRSRWPNSGHLVFIGTFCLPDEPDLLLDKYTFEIADTSFSSDETLYCFHEAEIFHTLSSIRIAQILNDVHCLEKSEKYWAILTGVWLRLFTDLISSRLSTLRKLISTFADLRIIGEDSDPINRAAFNTVDFHKLTRNARWNSLVYLDLWDLAQSDFDSASIYGFKPLPIEPLDISNHQSGFVLSATYLPRFQEILLQLRLFSFPRRINVIPAPTENVNKQMRDRLTLDNGHHDKFTQEFFNLICRYMPTVFFEGFNNAANLIPKMKFQLHPRAIFTSNRHLYDDVFNLWAAEATECGTCLVLGQHGGNYGISRFPSYAERHESFIANAYITWGWDAKPDSIPGMIFTTIGFRWKRSKNPSRALIVTDHLWSQPRTAFHDLNESSDYLEHILSLVRSLHPKIQDSLTIRLHNGQSETGSRANNIWREQLPTIDFGRPKDSFKKLVGASKMVIVAHNSTTLPETMSLGIPTLITWTQSWVEIREDAGPIFAKLAEVGIYHEDPVALANHISNIWEDVDGWWNSSEVLKARELFCHHYARSVPMPLRFLHQLLVDVSPAVEKRI